MLCISLASRHLCEGMVLSHLNLSWGEEGPWREEHR
jgi:hypothetical protein